MKKQHSWPIGVSPADIFNDVFGLIVYNGSILFDGMTLGAVIELKGNANPHKIGLHVVGAYINAIAFGDRYAYTPEQIVTLLQNAAPLGSAAVESLAIQLDQVNNEFDEDTSWTH